MADDPTPDLPEPDTQDIESEPEQKDIDWKSMSRKHETRARKSQAELERLRKELQEREDGAKSEHEKAIAKARAEAKQEAEAEYAKVLRSNSLEVAVTRTAASPIKIGEESLRFADPEDAQMHIERMIRRGEIDEDDLYGKDGKIDASVLKSALAELLQSKPHLAAVESNGRKVKGSADGGKGSGPGPDLRTSMTVEQAREWRTKHAGV